MKFISSPHLRTIQTAAAFQFEFTASCQTPIILDLAIAVNKDIMEKGAFKNYNKEQFEEQMMKKASNFVVDVKAKQISSGTGNSSRYKAGF